MVLTRYWSLVPRVSTLQYEGTIIKNIAEWEKLIPYRAKKRKGSYIIMKEWDETELKIYTIRGSGGKVGCLEENRRRGPKNGDQIGA